jgi:signal transduction histidine kinase
MPEHPSKRARQLSRLIELNHLSASLDSGTFLQSLVEIGAELTSSDFCSILALDADRQQLRFIAGPWLQMPRLQSITVPLDGSIAGETFLTNQSILVNDAETDPRLYSQVQTVLEMRTRKLLSVPIRRQEVVLGVMQAVNKFTGDYDHEDTAFLFSLAAQAGTMLHIMQMEKAAADLAAEAQALEERKDNFIAITSHELRTPLGVILGNATFLRELLHNPELAPQIEAITISALRMKEVIESLTHADHVQSGTARLRLHQVNLNQLLEDLVASYQGEALRNGLSLELELPEQPVTIDGEAEKLGVAIQNLLRNALTFTDSGGSIQVSLRPLDGYAQISVSDTGIGIPESDLELVFDRFYQVESHLTRRHGGMGLGLSVAKAMVEMHGGQIWVQSTPGHGSTFVFILPLHAYQSTSGRSAQDSPGAPGISDNSPPSAAPPD